MVPTTHNLEVLSDALTAALRAGEFEEAADGRAWIRQENLLIDAAVDCGMDRDTVDHRAWASKRVTDWLLEGVEPSFNKGDAVTIPSSGSDEVFTVVCGGGGTSLWLEAKDDRSLPGSLRFLCCRELLQAA